MSEEGAKKGSSLLAIFLFGFLSMIFAEVFSGASPLWFLGIWGWFVTLPLYWAHALLLLNLAMKYERTSLTQLYLWGVIFGLYEGWMTKVIWAGYMGDIPAYGVFLGFAVGEFFVIALFWHALFSFIIPILVFQIIVQATNKGEAGSIHTSHLGVISRRKRNYVLLGIIIVAGSLFMMMGLGADSFSIMIAGITNLAYIVLLSWFVTSWNSKPLDLESLRLGKTGLSITIIYLFALYLYTFFTLFPERIPPLGTILLTIAFYGFVIILIFVSPRDNRKTIELPEGIIDSGNINLILVLFLMLSVSWITMGSVSLIIGTLFYLAMIFLGPILFFLAVLNVIRKALANR